MSKTLGNRASLESTETVENTEAQPRLGRNDREVIVVGGSAAGLFTAATVARGGRRVRVLESKPQFEPAPRTLIVTDHFRHQMGAAACKSIINEIRRFELFTDGRSAQIALNKPDLIIERSRLISALAREAEQAGATLSFDTRFLGIGPNARGLRLDVESGGKHGELHADSVVGADGAASRVARASGWPPIETVPLVQAIVRLPKDCPPDTTRVWFVPDDTPYFYWLIPESAERGAVGVIGEHGSDTKRCFESFLEKKHFERLQMLFFEKTFEASLRIAAVLADYAHGAAFRRFRDQPVKVRRVVRHEPDARGVGRAILRQADDGLNKGHGFNGRPSGSARDSARGTIRANHAAGVQLLAPATGFNLQTQTACVRTDSQEPRIE